MLKKTKVFLEYMSNLNSPSYLVTKIVNRLEPVVGSFLTQVEVSLLVNRISVDVTITKKK